MAQDFIQRGVQPFWVHISQIGNDGSDGKDLDRQKGMDSCMKNDAQDHHWTLNSAHPQPKDKHILQSDSGHRRADGQPMKPFSRVIRAKIQIEQWLLDAIAA